MKIKFASAKLKSFLAVLILAFAAATAFSQTDAPFSINTSPLPAPTGAVNDYAGVIDPATKQQLEEKLKQFKEKTGVELAVAVVKSTGDRPIFDYSLAVARGWKIGSKEDDNPSALLFVAIDDRKFFTQVSKDLEDELPDGIVGNLQRQFLVPEFRKGNYAKGIADTLDAYIRTTEERRSGGAPPAETEKPKDDGPGSSQILSSSFCCLLIIGVILLIIFSNRGGKNRKGDHDDWSGGFGGGGSALPWVIGSILASGSGSSSSSGDWGSSSGGSDWGGFGGGGDFGGGGAGGDW
ncbi:MAG: TPM domain-containing protein [Saprospiraceae bacterium]|nr:TPM domain-containing protein [Pyrinomonadaceae bacterium]